MNFSALHKKVVVGVLFGTTALAAIAPLASASTRYRAGYRVDSYPVRSYRSHSNAGPVIAGIIGGIAIGALLASASNSHASGGYSGGYSDGGYYEPEPYRYDDQDCYYVDPCTDQSYATLNVYVGATDGCSYPRFVRVMDRRSNRCLRTIRYTGGGWQDCGAGYGGYSDTYFRAYRGGHGYSSYGRGYSGYGGGYTYYGGRGGYGRSYDRTWQRDGRGTWQGGGRGDWQRGDRGGWLRHDGGNRGDGQRGGRGDWQRGDSGDRGGWQRGDNGDRGGRRQHGDRGDWQRGDRGGNDDD